MPPHAPRNRSSTARRTRHPELAEYYANELAYLHDAARAFAQSHPNDAARLLEQSEDPDVERLLEGVAFLTAGVRARIDQASDHVAHGLAELILPHFLRSLPSATIVEFTPHAKSLRARYHIPRERRLTARPIDGTACTFRTCLDVDLWPLSVRDAYFQHPTGRPPRIDLQLDLVDTSAAVLQEDPHPLRLFIHRPNSPLPATLLLWLTRHLKAIYLRSGEGAPVTLEPSALRPLDGAEAAIFPWTETAPVGYRSVLEFFAIPEKFCFLDLSGLEKVEIDGDRLTISFELDSPPPLTAAIDRDTFRLHCTPALNLFEAPAVPITINPLGREALIRADGIDPRHTEVYEVLSVTSMGSVGGGRKELAPFTRQASTPKRESTFALRRTPSPHDGNVDTFLTLSAASDPRAAPDYGDELLSVELLCTNRGLAGELRQGDLAETLQAGPLQAYRNITDPSPPVPLALGSEALWRLLSHMSLNQRGPADADALRELLHLYNFHALTRADRGPLNARQIDSIRELTREPVTRTIRGVPMRATKLKVELDERNFGGLGGAYLFGQVLDDLFGSFVPLNAASELVLILHPSRREYSWPVRIGA